jgi:hypothetical protein
MRTVAKVIIGIHVASEEVLRLRTVAKEAEKNKQSIIFLPCIGIQMTPRWFYALILIKPKVIVRMSTTCRCRSFATG